MLDAFGQLREVVPCPKAEDNLLEGIKTDHTIVERSPIRVVVHGTVNTDGVVWFQTVNKIDSEAFAPPMCTSFAGAANACDARSLLGRSIEGPAVLSRGTD